jgi:hypothetical protein
VADETGSYIFGVLPAAIRLNVEMTVENNFSSDKAGLDEDARASL